MHRDGVVKVALRRAHLDSDAHGLDHLVGAHADHVNTDDLLLLAGAHDLVRGGHLVREEAVVHRREARAVDGDLLPGVLAARGRLAEPDRACGRVREDRRGDVGVVEVVVLELFRAEEAVRQAAPGGDGHGRELRLALDVADGVHVLGARVLVLVHDDVALLVRLDLRRVQTEVLRVGVAPDRPQQRVDLDRVARVKVHGERPALLALDLGHVRVREHVHARVLHHLGDRVRDDRVKDTEHLVVADRKVRLGAERVEDPRELHGDVAGADDERALRLLAQRKEAVRVDAEARAGDLLVARDRRAAAGGDDDVVGGERDLLLELAVRRGRHAHLAVAEQLAVAGDVVDVVLLEVAVVDAVQAADVRIALLREVVPVDARDGERLAGVAEAVLVRLLEVLLQVGRVPHELLGHAADIDAGAAEHAGLFNDDGLLAVGCGAAARAHPAGAATEDNQIVVRLAGWVHRGHGGGSTRVDTWGKVYRHLIQSTNWTRRRNCAEAASDQQGGQRAQEV